MKIIKMGALKCSERMRSGHLINRKFRAMVSLENIKTEELSSSLAI
jgi:hypothetical protein